MPQKTPKASTNLSSFSVKQPVLCRIIRTFVNIVKGDFLDFLFLCTLFNTASSAAHQILLCRSGMNPEILFVDLLRSPGIDSQPCGPVVRQPYLSYRLAKLHRLTESIPRNRFLGLHKRLQIRALDCCGFCIDSQTL
jgi:hypothetical protein